MSLFLVLTISLPKLKQQLKWKTFSLEFSENILVRERLLTRFFVSCSFAAGAEKNIVAAWCCGNSHSTRSSLFSASSFWALPGLFSNSHRGSHGRRGSIVDTLQAMGNPPVNVNSGVPSSMTNGDVAMAMMPNKKLDWKPFLQLILQLQIRIPWSSQIHP